MIVRMILDSIDSFYSLTGTDQGMTPMLSKFWMPLDQFTGLAMEGLIRGDDDIAVGDAMDVLDKFDKGKAEVAARMHTGNSVLKMRE